MLRRAAGRSTRSARRATRRRGHASESRTTVARAKAASARSSRRRHRDAAHRGRRRPSARRRASPRRRGSWRARRRAARAAVRKTPGWGLPDRLVLCGVDDLEGDRRSRSARACGRSAQQGVELASAIGPSEPQSVERARSRPGGAGPAPPRGRRRGRAPWRRPRRPRAPSSPRAGGSARRPPSTNIPLVARDARRVDLGAQGHEDLELGLVPEDLGVDEQAVHVEDGRAVGGHVSPAASVRSPRRARGPRASRAGRTARRSCPSGRRGTSRSST